MSKEQISDSIAEQTSVGVQDPNPDSVPERNSDDFDKQTVDNVTEQNQPDVTPEDQTADLTSDKTSVKPSGNEQSANEEKTHSEESHGMSDDSNQTSRQEIGGEEEEEEGEKEEENSPIVEKLTFFLKDPFRKELEFAGDISSHERYLVHKFVQEHGLTCESTGNNTNHKFVVAKVDEDVDDLDYGTGSGDDGEDKMDVGDGEVVGGDVGDGEVVGGDDGDGEVVGGIVVSPNQDDVVELYSDLKEVETMQDAAEPMPPTEGTKKPNQNKTKFNPKHVNGQLSLRDLKLDKFSGCYKMNSHGHYLNAIRHICETVKIPFQIVLHDKETADNSNVRRKADSYTGCQASVYINDIHVCDGYGKNRASAKEIAVQTAIRYLQRKGLTLWNTLQLEKRFILAKRVEELGDDKNTFKRNFETFVEECIVDPNIVQLRVVGRFQKQTIDDWRRSIMVGVIHQYHLRKEITGNMFRATKVNSLMHKLHVYPAKEESLESCPPVEDGPNKCDEIEIGNGQATTTLSAIDLSQKTVVNELKPVSLGEIAKQKYDRLNASLNLHNLRPIKLDQFQGVVTRKDVSVHKLSGLIIDMTEAVGVSCEFKVKGPFDGPRRLQWRSFLSINNVFIAKGFSKTDSKSKSDCAKNAFYFLLSIGLKIIFDDEICDGQIKKVEKAEVESSSMREQFTSFLEEKNSIKMKFCYRVSQPEKELFEALCDSYSLSRIFDGTGEIIALKKNSHLHKMELYIKEAEQNRASNQSAILLSKEDLTVNSSIRDHIQQFVNNDSLLELQFPEDLEVTQKELIEVLAEKHKLKHDVEGSGQIILSKDPDDLAKVLETKTGPSFSEVARKPTKKQRQKRRDELAGIPSSVTPKPNERKGIKRPIISAHGEVITKTFRTSNYSGKQRGKPNPNHQRIRGNNWRNNGGNREVNREVTSQVNSGMEFSWVSDVVNRAVNTAVKVNSAVSSVMISTGSSTANKSHGALLLNPPYMSADRSNSSSFNQSQNISGYQHQLQASDWQNQSANSPGTQSRRFTSLGSKSRSIKSPTPTSQMTSSLSSYQSNYQQESQANYQSSGYVPFKPFEPYYSTSSTASLYQNSQEDPYYGTDYESRYSSWHSQGGSPGKHPVPKSNWGN